MSSKPHPRLTEAATLRRLPLGEVIGSREADGSHAWRGIRYAQAPVGSLRWRAPQPRQTWPGVELALQHGHLAPQFAGLLAPVPPAAHGSMVGEEDCLSLNVFSPAFTPATVPDGSDRLPVMVWIHGGGNAVGTSATYDVARKLALHDDVVVVTINYRLGVLGWFAHPALQGEPGVTAEERSGNFGLLDQIAALRWVQDNIHAFGGDPACVTIFGESAGGQNVLLLMASPLAAGLFHRAIAQSPVCESFSLQEAIEGIDSPLESRQCGTREVVRRLHQADGSSPCEGVAEADYLRALTPAQLLAVHKPGSVGIYLTPRPARDGVVLPLAPLIDVFASGRFNRVPVILGSNRDEYRTFLADKPEHSRLLFGKVPMLRERAVYLAESSCLSRAWRAHHVDAPADAMLAGGHADVWTYRFDWDEAPAIPFIRPDLLLGAAHAMEMAFAFRDLEGEMDVFKVNTPFNRAGRLILANAMADAWTCMARAGAPTLPSGNPWQRRTAGAGSDSMIFDTVRDGGVRMAALRSTLETIKRDLMTGVDSVPDTARAQVFARVFLWSPLFAGHADGGAYEQVVARFGGAAQAQTYRPQLEI